MPRQYSNGGRDSRRPPWLRDFRPLDTQQITQGARGGSKKSTSFPDDGLAHKPAIDGGIARAAVDTGGIAGRHLIRRQAHH